MLGLTLKLILAFLMFGMGASLRLQDFRRVAQYPQAVLIGLFNQLFVLPIIAALLVCLLPMPPYIALGLVIIAACPGGATSNLISHLARADLALSITLTACSSLITVFSIPLIINFALLQIVGNEAQIQLHILPTIQSLALLTLLPVALGMFFKSKFPSVAKKSERWISLLSVGFILVAIGLIVQQLALRGSLLQFVAEAGLGVFLLVSLSFLLGFASARIFGLNLNQSKAISIESGIQNNVLGITLATAFLNLPEAGTAAGVHAIFMVIVGFGAVYIFRRI